MSPLGKVTSRPLHYRRLLLVGCIGTLAVGGLALYRRSHLPVPPFHFPNPELAALDRDLQARFAVVPDKDFGIERTYGNQHYLYNPQSQRELATIHALKQKNTDAAFYLMSRALWLRSWDGWGYKPIQGPVHLTGRITLPLPRIINFMPPNNKVKGDVVDQEHGMGADGPSFTQELPAHNPDGTPVASSTPPPNVPKVNALQEIGNRVFEMAEEAPTNQKVGLSQKINEHWRVIAVPIRASQPECISCHTYHPLGNTPSLPGRTKIEVGDALGVAFYLYSTAEQQHQQKQAIENALIRHRQTTG